MQDVMFKCWAKAQIAKQQAKQNIKSFFSGENGGADSLVIAIVLIVIVIAVGAIFREQIKSFVENLFGAAESKFENEFN